jgi:hypothetical protein
LVDRYRLSRLAWAASRWRLGFLNRRRRFTIVPRPRFRAVPFPLISQSMLTEYFFENISSSKALVVIAILISAASLCYVRVRSDRMHRVAPPRQINGKRA